MSNVTEFVSKESKLADAVAEQVASLRQQDPLILPTRDAPIVTSFIKQIEGTYDSQRAKTDTDHAIDLLYIAYNTTPQAQGEIRNTISGIMSKLIDAQQSSHVSIKEIVGVASSIDQRLRNTLPDWLDIKTTDEPQEIKDFVAKDLLKLADLIKNEALQVKSKLMSVADEYQAIIDETQQVTQRSELILSEAIQANAKLAADMRIAQARSEQLETMVEEMRSQVERFQKLADDYQRQAESAQSKAFWASFVRGALQVVSAVMPIVAMVATSGAGAPALAVGAVVGSVNLKVNKDRSAQTEIKLREEQTCLQTQNAELKLEIEGHQSQVKLMSDELGTVAEENVENLKGRLDTEKQSLQEALNKQIKLEASMGEIQAALAKLENGAAQLSEQQALEAKNLNQLQLEMISKVELYETKRSESAVELAGVRALMVGQHSEEEMNELTIRSLEQSMSALKRTKEIVVEIAYFFMSFSTFMQGLATAAQNQAGTYDDVVHSNTLRAHKRAMVIASTDEFFIEQTAQWLAVGHVCEVFANSFAEGWSKLNSLSGTYISGDELSDYLKQAGAKIDEITHARTLLKAQRLGDLDSYRQQIIANADQA